MLTALHPTTFHRHNRPLRALLLESQVWFCTKDMGRLIGWPLNERTTRKLDADQRQVMRLMDSHGEEDALMVSESAAYALLVHHYHVENRGLRRWITHEVVPCLRDKQMQNEPFHPYLSFLHWPRLSVIMLHWQSEPWIRLRDMPQVLADADFSKCDARKSGSSWRQAVRRFCGRSRQHNAWGSK